jgi:hypothetical protein
LSFLFYFIFSHWEVVVWALSFLRSTPYTGTWQLQTHRCLARRPENRKQKKTKKSIHRQKNKCQEIIIENTTATRKEHKKEVEEEEKRIQRQVSRAA